MGQAATDALVKTLLAESGAASDPLDKIIAAVKALIPASSIAVDPSFLPLGAPVFLSTTQSNSELPMQRLVMAQDTGGAIRGEVRADFFFGFGHDASENAGRMKQRGALWVLLPKPVAP